MKNTHFSKVPKSEIDPIMKIMEIYSNSKAENKINLTVGAYRTEELQPYVFPSVKQAERDILNDSNKYRGYPSPTGDEVYLHELAKLLFQDDSEIFKNNRLFSCQSLSGTGAVRLIAEYIARYGKESMKTVYVPNPTWANHPLIFIQSGLEVVEYFFYNEKSLEIDFEYMKTFLLNCKKGSTILFHTCAFNPTGTDFSKDEWEIMINLCADNNLFIIFDTAYQGFASGNLIDDIFPILLAAEKNLEFAIAQSLSKSMGLYGERAGGLHILFKNQGGVEENTKINLKLKTLFTKIVFSLYLVPVDHGSQIIKIVLQKYKDQWKQELKDVVDRLISMRKLLYHELVENKCPGNWEIILKQRGMFAYTGLTINQCEYLIEKKNLFLVKSGRISVCGLNKQNVKRAADYIKEAIENA